MRAPLLCGLSRQAAAPSRTNALSRTSVRRRPGNQALNCFIPSDIELFRLVSNLRRDPDEQKYAQAEELSRDRCDNCSERTIGGGVETGRSGKTSPICSEPLPVFGQSGKLQVAPQPPAFQSDSRLRTRVRRALPLHCPRSAWRLELGLKEGDPEDPGACDPGRIAVELWTELVFIVD